MKFLPFDRMRAVIWKWKDGSKMISVFPDSKDKGGRLFQFRWEIFYLLIICLFLVQWSRLFFRSQIPVDGNTLRFFYPSWAIGKKLLVDFHSLLWDPYRGLGQPFLGLPQNQAIYPFLFLSPWLEFVNHVKLFLFCHVMLFVVFTVRLTERWVSRDRKVLFVAAILATLSGFFVNRVTDLGDISSLCWVPMILYFFSVQNSAWLGISLAMQWFSGFPPFSLLSLGLLFGLCWSDGDPLKSIIFMVRSCALFLGLAAVQWIPFLELLQQSTRSILLKPEAYLEYALTPLELLRGVFSVAFFSSGDRSLSSSDPAVVGFYFGLISTGFFILGLFRGRPTVKWLAFFSLAGLWMALGQNNGVYARIPGIGFFRFPAQWLMWSVVLWPIVVAQGFSVVKSKTIQTGLIFLFVLDGLAYSWDSKSVWITPSLLKYDPIGLIRNHSLMAGAETKKNAVSLNEKARVTTETIEKAFSRNRRSGISGKLCDAGEDFVSPEKKPLGGEAPSGQEVLVNPVFGESFDLRERHGRVRTAFSGRLLHAPPLLKESYNWNLLGEKSWVDFIGLKLPSMLAAEGIREVISHTSLPLKSNQLLSEKLSQSSFRSSWVDFADVSLLLLRRSAIDQRHLPSMEELVLVPNAGAKGRAFMLNGGACRTIVDQPGRLTVEAQGPGLLVFSESRYPGWKARVNGKMKKVSSFEKIFLSLELDQKGSQTVEFFYRPSCFLLGCAVSVLTLLGMLLNRTFVFFKTSHFQGARVMTSPKRLNP